METYLRMMFLKFRYRLGYETLCREVGDSISWQRFCPQPRQDQRPGRIVGGHEKLPTGGHESAH